MRRRMLSVLRREIAEFEDRISAAGRDPAKFERFSWCPAGDIDAREVTRGDVFAEAPLPGIYVFEVMNDAGEAISRAEGEAVDTSAVPRVHDGPPRETPLQDIARAASIASATAGAECERMSRRLAEEQDAHDKCRAKLRDAQAEADRLARRVEDLEHTDEMEPDELLSIAEAVGMVVVRALHLDEETDEDGAGQVADDLSAILDALRRSKAAQRALRKGGMGPQLDRLLPEPEEESGRG